MLTALVMLTGWCWVLAGLVALRGARVTGVLAVLAGASWLLATPVPAIALVHRPLMLHVAVLVCGVTAPRRPAWALLALAWVGALVVPVGRLTVWAMLLAALALVVVALVVRARRAGRTASGSVVPMTLLAAALLSVVALRAAADTDPAVVLTAYSWLVAAAGVATGVVTGRRWAGGETDAAIELSDREPARTVARLRSAALAGDALSASALGLLDEHDRLQHQLEERVAQVRVSRRRLVLAVSHERAAVARRLAVGPVGDLQCLRSVLGDLAGALEPGDASRLIAAARSELEQALEDLDLVSRGLQPRALAELGLDGGLRELAAGCVVPTTVLGTAPPVTGPAAEVVWYACAEALANVAKHAGATAVVVDVVRRPDLLEVRICDDGRGGAKLEDGGGLAGLVDRVRHVGGELRLDTNTGRGTAVVVCVPLSVDGRASRPLPAALVVGP